MLLSCLHAYAQRSTSLASEMQADLQEFRAAGTVSRVRQLAKVSGHSFNDNRLPQYFTGCHQRTVVATAPAQPSGWQTQNLASGERNALFGLCSG